MFSKFESVLGLKEIDENSYQVLSKQDNPLPDTINAISKTSYIFN